MSQVAQWTTFKDRYIGGDYDRYFYLIGILGGLLIWEIVGRIMPVTLFAPFTMVVETWIGLLNGGTLIPATLDSLTHAVVGFILAILVGIPLGFLMGRSEKAYWAINGPLNALYATPLVAVIPLIVVWFGIGLRAKIVLVFLMAFIELTVNVFQGVRDVSETYDTIGTSFGASTLQRYRKILIPAILPFIFTGLRLAIGRSVRGMIVAELFVAIGGIGGLLVDPVNRFNVATQLALIGTVTLLGVIAQSSIKGIDRYLIHWPTQAERGE